MMRSPAISTHTPLRWARAALLMSGLLTPALVHGQSLLAEGIPGCDFVSGQVTAVCIPNFIAYLIKLIFGLTGTIALVNIMIAGYELALSGVTEDKDAGKNRLKYSAIGFIVCAGAFLIVDFVISALLGA